MAAPHRSTSAIRPTAPRLNVVDPDEARESPGSNAARRGVRLSSHILPTAGTMVGVCTTLIGLVKIAEMRTGPGFVDKCYGLTALVFLVSAFTSYLAMRVESDERMSLVLERIADWCFMVGLIGLSTVSLLFAYETI